MHARSRRALVLVPLVLALVLTALLVAPPPAAAESFCEADEAGDVVDRATSAVADVPEADILAVCADHRDGVLEVTVRVASPTDPATHEGWEGFSAVVAATIDVDGDGREDFDVNYGRFPDGQVRTQVFRSTGPGEASEMVCEADSVFNDSRYRMTIPTDCIGNPAEVWVAAYVYWDSDPAEAETRGYYDEVPAAPQFLGPFSADPDPDTGALRLAGDSRVETAIAVSQDDFADGSASAAVLALADNFPDALAAAPLAVAVDGPLLLTPGFAVAGVVEAELRRVLPEGGTVFLSGGTAALEPAVQAEVEAMGYEVERVAGDTRYATSVAIAEATAPEPELIVVADGNDFPDALVGGALAGARSSVEILSNGPELTAEAAAYLAAHPDAEVVAIGAVAAQAVPDAEAYVGATPMATSVAVAEAFFADADTATLASGTNFPDGLTGGAHAGRAGAPLLLTWPDVLDQGVRDQLVRSGPGDIVLYGGVLALSYQVEADAVAAAG